MNGLIEEINQNALLKTFICKTCNENETEVRIDGDIKNWCIIDPEAYFKSLKTGNTPSAVDCLVSIECKNSGYGLFLVELKSSPRDLDREYARIYKKFSDTLDKFIFGNFKAIFANGKVGKIRLLVVHRITKKDRNLLMRTFLQPVKWADRKYYIDLQLSPYTITKC